MKRLIIPLTFVAFFTLGCARSFNPDIVRGSSYEYQSGYPEVRLSAIGFLDESDVPHINIASDIVYGSLIYKKEGPVFYSDIAIEIMIIDESDPNNIVENQRFTLTLEDENSSISYSQDVFTFERRIPVQPGEYQVNLTVIDQNSGKETTRTSRTFIPDPNDNISNLTNIRLLGKDNETDGTWVPITTYDVAGRVDSLKFVFQVTNNLSESPMTIDSRLVRFESDTTEARAMHVTNYGTSSLAYRGIDYDERELIQSNRRVLTQSGSVLVEFIFPQMRRGNYRFEVNTTEEQENQFKARDFSVKSENYPALKTPRELAEPLVYLMEDREHERLLQIQNPDSMKQEIDRFWLRNIGNISRARDVIEMYYQRVEEANKQFSNFKEGWKTDEGMIYILFGEPWYVNEHVDLMRWSYTYDPTNPQYNFIFRKSNIKSEFFPFDNYVFQRHQLYFQVQYQQEQLWLSGLILTRGI